MNIFQSLKHQYLNNDIVQKIIFWNIGVFILSLLFCYNFKSASFDFYSFMTVKSSLDFTLYNPWTLFIYMFVHNGFIHILFNMLMLHFVSRFFLTFFTEKQFLVVYISGGIFSGLVFVLFFHFLGIVVPLVGASAAVMSLLVVATVYAPNYLLKIPLIGTIKLWYITAILLGIDVIIVSKLFLEQGINYSVFGGRFSHIAGALFGFIYVKLLQNGFDLAKLFSKSNFPKKKKKTPFSKVHINTTSSNLSKHTKTSVEQKQIDEILDKISKSGYDSLSKEEKEFLFKIGK
jgi:membrane associated rhomboid family serine protease